MRRRLRSPAGSTGLAVAAALAVALAAGSAAAVQDLARNGDFTTASSTGLPEGWSTESWLKSDTATAFTWAQSENGIGAATIRSREPNDASWIQSVGVSPSTWYRVSAWVRTEDVGTERMGAYVSVMDTFFYSEDLRGTRPWTPVVLWVKTGKLDTSIKVALRLGGYSSLNTGTAHFSMVSVEPAGTPPRGSKQVYGGSGDDAPSGGLPWARLAALLVASGMGLVLWRYLFAPGRGSRGPGGAAGASAAPSKPSRKGGEVADPSAPAGPTAAAKPPALRGKRSRAKRAAMADKVRIYHNPGCGKSRGALEILEQRGVETEVIEYLKSPLDRKTFEGFLDLLGGEPAALVRKDKRFRELGLDEKDYVSREQVVEVLLAHPELMERPVVIRGGRAVIARPSERVLELFETKG